ncbi:MAG: hypothetical protein EON94_14260, partial [Caulobacteraceae bacterium]
LPRAAAGAAAGAIAATLTRDAIAPKPPRLKGTLRGLTAWSNLLIACGVERYTAREWSSVFASCIREDTFSQGDRDLVDFLPEVIHESVGLQVMEESLNYSVEGLMQTFGTDRISVGDCQRYGRTKVKRADQQAIANLVYGGKYGRDKLGNTKPGDGWRYRGRGPIQITGAWNYARMGELMGQDLLVVPELLAQPHYALTSAILWWEDRIPDSFLGETTSIRKRVNGGQIGLAKVQFLTDCVRKAIFEEAL